MDERVETESEEGHQTHTKNNSTQLNVTPVDYIQNCSVCVCVCVCMCVCMSVNELHMYKTRVFFPFIGRGDTCHAWPYGWRGGEVSTPT